MKSTTLIRSAMRNRLLILLLIVSLAAIGNFAGLFQYLDPDALRELIVGWGIWGPFLVVVLFSLVQPFGFPGAVFMMASSTLWPFWFAFAVNLAGATGAGMLGFGFARYLGRDWVEERMPERVRAWDERLSSRGLPPVILFRLVFFLNPPAHWALGLSRVRFRDAFLGTLIGFAPAVALWSYFGSQILTWLQEQPIEIWWGLFALIFGTVLFRRLRARRSRALSQ